MTIQEYETKIKNLLDNACREMDGEDAAVLFASIDEYLDQHWPNDGEDRL